MAGFGSWAPRRHMLPEVIENGCDVILFSDDPDQDMADLAAAMADGRLSMARLDAAVTRVLGLKAALGLHHGQKKAADQKAAIGTSANRALAATITARAPTLVKDVATLLPLSPAKHRRILIVSGGIVLPFSPVPLPFQLPDMLRAEGFAVTMFTPGMTPSPAEHDLMIYLFGEETLLTRGRIFLDWAKLTGNFGAAMQRHWHDIPTVMISFGYPYYLYDAPRAPVMINAYATMPSMQKAVVDCLIGRAEWLGKSPVDAFCGLPDARF